MAYRNEFGEPFCLDANCCKYPGCTRARYREPYGFIHEFCGKTHATAYSRLMSDKKSLGYQSSSLTDFKPKRGDKKPLQGRVTPLVGNHKVEHGYVPKSSMFSSPVRSLSHDNDIKFYHRSEPYYEFTNFSEYPVQLDGKQWPTTEHYFQAQKFIGTPYTEAIRQQPNARGAFDMSRTPSVSRWRRGDWDQVKDDIMLKCLRAKFTQHKYLRDKLLDTGERNLIEHTPNDSYWGDGGDGSGHNKLGKLLMQVRKDISKQVHQDKFLPYQSSLAYDRLKEKDTQKKHKRRNSISGITPNISTSTSISSSISSQAALSRSKQKFRSTENLYHPSYTTKNDSILSSLHSFERVTQQYGGLPHTSEIQPRHKATIKRSGSLSDVYQRSSSRSDQSSVTGKHLSNISSVDYNIITNK